MIFLSAIIISIILVFVGIYIQNKDSKQPIEEKDLTCEKWWINKRNELNFGLVISSFISFLSFIFLSNILTVDIADGLLLIFYHFLIYLFIMLIANLLYGIGYYIDSKFNKDNSLNYRQKLFKIEFWILIVFSFIKPILLII
jgi:predicted transporter